MSLVALALSKVCVGAQTIPDNDHSDNASQSQVEILPREEEGNPDAEAYHFAREQSYTWRGLDDDDCDIIIAGEVVLAQMQRRGFEDWLTIGHAIVVLQGKIRRQMQTAVNMGRRYNEGWAELAPPQIRRLTPSDRSNAVWLWENREVLRSWWVAQPPEKRDHWGHPFTIKAWFERTQGYVKLPRRREDEEEPSHTRGGGASRRQTMAAGSTG
jgi:hypothetical protein